MFWVGSGSWVLFWVGSGFWFLCFKPRCFVLSCSVPVPAIGDAMQISTPAAWLTATATVAAPSAAAQHITHERVIECASSSTCDSWSGPCKLNTESSQASCPALPLDTTSLLGPAPPPALPAVNVSPAGQHIQAASVHMAFSQIRSTRQSLM